MASPSDQHCACANCIGTLSFPIDMTGHSPSFISFGFCSLARVGSTYAADLSADFFFENKSG